MTANSIPLAFQGWHDLVINLGFVDILSVEDAFKSCLESGKPWSRSEASGVYCWIAENGEAYVGQAVSARKRLLAHARSHADIRYAAFQAVPREALDRREAELIARVNEVFPTRNIKLALQSAASVPFDQVVSPEEREAFLRGEQLQDSEGEWHEFPVLTQKQAAKFARFMRLPDAVSMMGALGRFVQAVLPKAPATEGRFWSVTLFPSPHILRVNVGQQEVFTIARGDRGEVFARPLALKPFDRGSLGPLYQTCSYDHWMPLAALDGWLHGERLLSARELAVWLMRHTTALNFASHCPQLLRFVP